MVLHGTLDGGVPVIDGVSLRNVACRSVCETSEFEIIVMMLRSAMQNEFIKDLFDEISTFIAKSSQKFNDLAGL